MKSSGRLFVILFPAVVVLKVRFGFIKLDSVLLSFLTLFSIVLFLLYKWFFSYLPFLFTMFCSYTVMFVLTFSHVSTLLVLNVVYEIFPQQGQGFFQGGFFGEEFFVVQWVFTFAAHEKIHGWKDPAVEGEVFAD